MLNDDLFCGSKNSYPTVEFTPKSRPWSSDLVIGRFNKADIKLANSVIQENKIFFWDNMCSEYDAENFCNFLRDEKIKLTDEFAAFEYVWRRDEFNHYLGFRHIYSTLCEIPATEVVHQVNERKVNFAPLRDLLEDEFKICLLLAYDEIATAKSYAMDYEFYSGFGHADFDKWIRLVARDEAYHFNNCMELIGRNFYSRINEIPKLIDLFIEWDFSGKEYEGTFVLDHGNYSHEFLIKCGQIIRKYFNVK